MDNQHQKITGYRDLSQDEIDLMNEIKAQGEQLGGLVAKMRTHRGVDSPIDLSKEPPPIDQRWVSIGATHLQEGLMALTRAVARPTTF